MLSGHGDDRHSYQQTIRADFSSNVVPGNLNPALISHLQNILPQINHYPEPDASNLSGKLAEHHRLKIENILVANGSVEAFYLLAQHFRACESTIYCPSFAEYEDACRIFEHKKTFSSFEEFGQRLTPPNSVHWLGNPNNPDGKITPIEEIEKWLHNHSNCFLIIDEAYAGLCSSFHSSISLLNKFSNLIIVRSFTKTFAIPGIRLGYILGSRKLIVELKKIKMPWSVNQLAIEAGKFILDNYEMMLPDLSQILANSQQLQAEISLLPGLEVTPSATNYFLLKTKKGTNNELKIFLLEKYGILVRDAGNFRFIGKNHVRIAVQCKKDNRLLIKALREWTCCL